MKQINEIEKTQVITCIIDKSFCQLYYSIIKSCIWLVLLKSAILTILCKSYIKKQDKNKLLYPEKSYLFFVKSSFERSKNMVFAP